jgi:hypothetical protein
MWLILQSGIIFAVVASNIHWRWTPNGYLAAGLGILAAYVATVAIGKTVDRLRRHARSAQAYSLRAMN